MTNFEVARQMFSSPAKAFTALKEKPVFALPMWLLLLGAALMIACYYAVVDIEWLREQQAEAANIPAAQREQMAQVPRAVYLVSSSILAPVGVLVIMTLGTLYFMLAGAITNVRYSFRQWFAFNWWCASPGIIAYIPAILIVLMSQTTEIDMSAMQPLSLNELVFHRGPSEPGYNFLQSVGLVQVVSAWLTIIGVKVWSGRSTLFSVVFGILPLVLIYGVWALFAFR